MFLNSFIIAVIAASAISASANQQLFQVLKGCSGTSGFSKEELIESLRKDNFDYCENPKAKDWSECMFKGTGLDEVKSLAEKPSKMEEDPFEKVPDREEKAEICVKAVEGISEDDRICTITNCMQREGFFMKKS